MISEAGKDREKEKRNLDSKLMNKKIEESEMCRECPTFFAVESETSKR